MIRLVEAFPALAAELARSLRAVGRAPLAQQVDEAAIASVTFDDAAHAGYIHVAPARALNVVEARVIGARYKESIPVDTPFDTVLDTDNFDRLTGIEVLAPGALTSELKRRARG